MTGLACFLLVLPVGLAGPSDEEEPYHAVEHWRGLTSGAAWHVAPAGLPCTEGTCGGSDGEIHFVLQIPPSVETLVLELAYERALPTHVLRLWLSCPDDRSGDETVGCTFAEEGTDVVRIRVDREGLEKDGFTLTGPWAWGIEVAEGLGTTDLLGVDAGLAAGQPFDMYVSIFHHAPAPDGFSAIPG